MPVIGVQVYGKTYLVDTAATKSRVREDEPLFFKAKHGDRETISMYRGCLIVRNTQYDGVLGASTPRRTTAAYLFGRFVLEGKPAERGSTFCIASLPSDASIQDAKRAIDAILESGVYR